MSAPSQKMQVITQVDGDLNGDGIPDQVKLVLYRTIAKEKTKDYQVVSAWPYYSDDTPPSDPANGGPFVLIIEHGASNTDDETENFLLYDPNQVSALATEAAEDLTTATTEEISEAGTALPKLPADFTGDILVLPTEAGIDTFVYWTGETYLSLEPLEML